MQIFYLALLGGFISFLATSLGALLFIAPKGEGKTNRWNFSIDFALGLMVSASAFTLIGPAAFQSVTTGLSSFNILLSTLSGLAFVYLLKFQVVHLEATRKYNTSHLILASVLMLHNFPEGLASGSALAGLEWKAALPILGGIAMQNVPEGALMVLCLESMGWRRRWAVVGGLASGLVELFGGGIAGVLLHFVQGILPMLLSFAGGSMLASVFIEMKDSHVPVRERVWSFQFVLGLASMPIIQFISN